LCRWWASRQVVVPAVSATACPGSTSAAAAWAIASFSRSWRCDFASKPGSSVLWREGAGAPPWTFSIRPVAARASRSRRTVISDTSRSSVSSLTRIAPRRRTSSTMSVWRWPASMGVLRVGGWSAAGEAAGGLSPFAQYPTRSNRPRQGVGYRVLPHSCWIPLDTDVAIVRCSSRHFPERSGAVLSEPDRFSRPEEEAHVGRNACLASGRGRQSPDDPAQAAGLRRGRRGNGLRAHRLGRRRAVGLPCRPARGGGRHRHRRLELLRPRPEESDGGGV